MAPKTNSKLTIHKSYICLIILLCGFFAGLLVKLGQYTSLKDSLLHKINNNSAAITRNHQDTEEWRKNVNKLFDKMNNNQQIIKSQLVESNLKIERLIVTVNNMRNIKPPLH